MAATPGLRTRVVTSFADVDAAAWDALVNGADNPFVDHAFLLALEHSGSIGSSTAWQPRLILAEQDKQLVGAVPAFVRADSFGEFIFDWQIADAARRAGLRYYPKLTVAVPFTPATGPRLLTNDLAVEPTLVAALQALQATEQASSTHVLYCKDGEAARLSSSSLSSSPAPGSGFVRRASLQFHWRNVGYGSFDDFLAALAHDERKQIKRERRRVTESGLVVETRGGGDVPASWWPRLYELYAGIYDRKWGRPYLTKAFFARIPQELADSAVVVVARDPARVGAVTGDVDGIVAMTLSFEKGKHCYGRHWGTDVDVPGLHFELCYYALIERAIARGQTLVEAGAQGEHKLKRGYLPVITHSVHSFADDRFGTAVARYFAEEQVAMFAERDALAAHSPFKEGNAPPFPLVAGL